MTIINQLMHQVETELRRAQVQIATLQSKLQATEQASASLEVCNQAAILCHARDRLLPTVMLNRPNVLLLYLCCRLQRGGQSSKCSR